jgi:hypothetical protein
MVATDPHSTTCSELPAASDRQNAVSEAAACLTVWTRTNADGSMQRVGGGSYPCAGLDTAAVEKEDLW